MLTYSKKNTPCVLVVCLTLLVICFVGVLNQQTIRASANDPQIEMAEDVAALVSKSPNVISTIPAADVDVGQSLAQFVIAYSDTGEVLASQAMLDGATPVLPKGVLDYVRSHGEDRITWEPKKGVRIAAVITRYSGAGQSGFILAGRSLREVERRENASMLAVLFAELVAFVLFGISFILFKKKDSPSAQQLRA